MTWRLLCIVNIWHTIGSTHICLLAFQRIDISLYGVNCYHLHTEMFYGWDNRPYYMYISVCKLHVRLPLMTTKYRTRGITKGHISTPVFSATRSKDVTLWHTHTPPLPSLANQVKIYFPLKI